MVELMARLNRELGTTFLLASHDPALVERAPRRIRLSRRPRRRGRRGGRGVTFVRLALRNLARNRRRTAATLAVVAAGTVALVLTAGFVRFSFDGLREAMIHGGLGHLEVASRAAVEAKGASALDRPLAEALADWRPLADRLARLDHVVAVGANLQVLGLAQSASGASFSFVGVGVEPERERAMGFETRLREGEPLADAAPEPGEETALLARGLAASLGVARGDVVTLVATSAGGMLNALDVRVAGIVTTGVAELDTRYLKVHLATAGRLLADRTRLEPAGRARRHRGDRRDPRGGARRARGVGARARGDALDRARASSTSRSRTSTRGSSGSSARSSSCWSCWRPRTRWR